MINVIQQGTGYMGQRVMSIMLRKGYNIVAAIDPKEDYVGKDIGEVIGLDRNIGVKVTNDVQSLLKEVKADIVADASYATELDRFYDQSKPYIEAGLNVVSLSEELAYPWIASPQLAKEIDETAKARNVTVVGTGINPGFSMDLIPLIFTSSCCNVHKIRVQRVADFGVYSLTRAISRFGVKPEEFRRGVLGKRVSMHTGLYQSLTMISDALGWKLDDVSQTWEVMSSRIVRKMPGLTVEPGTTAGFKMTAIGSVKGEARIIFDYYGLVHPNLEEDGVEQGTTIMIDGQPNLGIKVKGDTEKGDLVSASRLVNILPAVVDAKPGLISVKDLPVTPPLPDTGECG